MEKSAPLPATPPQLPLGTFSQERVAGRGVTREEGVNLMIIQAEIITIRVREETVF